MLVSSTSWAIPLSPWPLSACQQHLPLCQKQPGPETRQPEAGVHVADSPQPLYLSGGARAGGFRLQLVFIFGSECEHHSFDILRKDTAEFSIAKAQKCGERRMGGGGGAAAEEAIVAVEGLRAKSKSLTCQSALQEASPFNPPRPRGSSLGM